MLATLKDHDFKIKCLRITPDGKKIITGSWGHLARIWNIEYDQLTAELEQF